MPQNAGAVPSTDIPVRGEDRHHICAKPGDRDFVGQPATAELGAQMLARARAKSIRWVRFGAIVTADFNASRLTVRLDPQNRVASMRCG